MDSAHVTPEDVWSAFAELRRTTPLVHNITNYVAMDLSANVLLAAGASPAMVHAVEEAGEFAGIASALVVNIGTLSPAWVDAMGVAARVAHDRGIPWVLDPVAAGATAYRTSVATELLDIGPTVVRGNASEILALAGAVGSGGRGVDSTDSADAALDAAVAVAGLTGGVVAVTGEVDVVTDGRRTVRIAGGDAMVTRITAVGCSLSALVAAFATVGDDRVLTTAAAMTVLSVAVERAAAHAAGPGSLRVRLLDELHALEEKDVLAGARLR
jgi:hydroxyethylthiazole kinase